MSENNSVEDMLSEMESDEFSMVSHLLRPPDVSVESTINENCFQNNYQQPRGESIEAMATFFRQEDQQIYDNDAEKNRDCDSLSDIWYEQLLSRCGIAGSVANQPPDQEVSLEEENIMLKRALVQILGSSATGDNSSPETLSDSLSSCKTSLSSNSTNLVSASQNCNSDGATKYKVRSEDDDASAARRRDAISSTKTTPKSQGLFEIVGLEEAKSTFHEALIMPMKFPHLFEGLRKKISSILLYGPPGTGKTYLAHSVAAEVSADFYCISSSDLLSVWLGESEKLIKELFNMKYDRGEKKIVIFIDEIDSLCKARSTDEADHSRRLKTELLVQMDASSQNDIFVICATNCPWDLDKAFLRRFQRKVYIGSPDRESRLKFLAKYESMMSCGQFVDWTEILDKTEGYTGSDLEQMAQCALLQPVRELRFAQFWKYTADGQLQPTNDQDYVAVKGTLDEFPPHLVVTRNVELADFVASLQQVAPTNSSADFEKYKNFANQSGVIC
ncbi:Hypothetical predicted protein [Cloeon dipterum]|uniref:AAA+ ATPase domain-containing protein n=1 Tax=Cloeon dipterum TaxID=197152 RepID=A0A8S1D8Y5_9INSE|nr:Hypothetical predicted protein [Cloeon dipterum]